MVIREELNVWPRRQSTGRHHIQPDAILQRGKFLRYGYIARAYAPTVIPGKEGPLVLEITSAEYGPIEARATRWAFAKAAMKLMAKLKECHISQNRARRYVFTFKVWNWK